MESQNNILHPTKIHDSIIENNLCQWIIQNGGRVHKNLAIVTPNPVNLTDKQLASSATEASHNKYSQRGIFATLGPISRGEELIRIPLHLALDGKDLPVEYGNNKHASPWLRCLASLIQSWYLSQNSPHDGVVDSTSLRDNRVIKGDHQSCHLLNRRISYKPYLISLPETFESLLNWSTWELRSFLAGTSLSKIALQDISDDNFTIDMDHQRENAMHHRFQTTVAPYLKHLKDLGFFTRTEETVSGIVDKLELSVDHHNSIRTKRRKTQSFSQEDGSNHSGDMEFLYPFFRVSCMCISTRAFHMYLLPDASDSNRNDSPFSKGREHYHGPYLLPYIDLLNHAPRFSDKNSTILRRDLKDGSYVMVAERDILKGEEICHSYDCDRQYDDDVYVGSDSVLPFNEGTNDNVDTSDSLNSAQFLQTFGFVDVEYAVKRLLHCFQKNNLKFCRERESLLHVSNMTPAIVTKNDICHMCKEVSQSSYPMKLRTFMNNLEFVDEGWEYWDMPTVEDFSESYSPCLPRVSRKVSGTNNEKHVTSLRQTCLDEFPDDVVITFDNPLSEDLITIACLNFLPDEAIYDLFDDSFKKTQQRRHILLKEEILDDYFLGKLVLCAVTKLVNEKLMKYKVLHNNISERCDGVNNAFLGFIGKMYKEEDDNHSVTWGENEVDDLSVLTSLIFSDDSGDAKSQNGDLLLKFKYGLIVSLEERASLLQLKKTVLNKIQLLDEL